MARKPSQRLERRHIDVVVMVSRHGSIHAAARALGYPQPLVTNLLRDAEHILGRPLFTRSHLGCTAIADCRHILNGATYAAKALETLDDAHGSSPAATLRLGCIPRATHVFMPAVLRILDGMGSPLHVDVVEGTGAQLQAQLAEGELDCFIGRWPVDVEQGKNRYVVESLYQDKTVLIAGTGHPLAGKQRLSLKDLSGYPWILPKTRSHSREILNELFSREGLTPPHSTIESMSFLSNLHLASKSDCISIAPGRAASEFEALGLIRILKTIPDLGEYTIVMICHDLVAQRPGFEDFRVAIRQAAEQMKQRERPQPRRKAAGQRRAAETG